MSEWPITNNPISSDSESLCSVDWLAMVVAAAIAIVLAVMAKGVFFLSSNWALTTGAVSIMNKIAIQYHKSLRTGKN